MAELTNEVSVLFNEESIINLRIADIGYHDFRIRKPMQMFHIRSKHIVHFVRNGCGTLVIGDRTYDVNEGAFFLVPPNIPTMYYPKKENPWRYYWFSLFGDAAEDTVRLLNLSIDNPVVPVKASMKITKVLDALHAEATNSTQQYYKAMASFMEILAVSQSKSHVAPPIKNTAEIVSDVRKVIELNFNNTEFKINEISKMLYISHSYMCKIFKEQVGCTPISYLINTRLHHAKEKLQERNYSVKELSQAVGFCDEPYFMKRFKQKYGMTVREYRKMIEKQT